MARISVRSSSVRAVGVTVTVLCLAVSACGGADDEQSPKAGVAATTTTSAAEDPVVTSVPSGKWTLEETVVSSKGAPDFKPGVKSDPTTWTFTPDCTNAAACGGQIRSSSGRSFTFTWDGSTLTVVRSGSLRSVHTTPCVDDAGKDVPGTSYKLVQLLDRDVPLAADVTTDGSVPQRFAGTVISKLQRSTSGGCRLFGKPRGSATASWVLTPAS